MTHVLVEQDATMISFVPTNELCLQKDQENVNNEYVFIIDCSGSMAEESKIGYARQAMLVFLKAIPVQSSFNVIRFGSSYEILFKNDTVVEYNEQNERTATHYIENMQADLGGTELYEPLKWIMEHPPKTNHSRQIFLLSDGEITDVHTVLDLCKQTSLTTRIFSFGLGSSPSRALIKGLARSTNGSYVFIPPNTHVDIAVAKQMSKALAPSLIQTKIKCNLGEYVISPRKIPPIYANQRLNIYLLMKTPITTELNGTFEFYSNNKVLPVPTVAFLVRKLREYRYSLKLGHRLQESKSLQARFNDLSKEIETDNKAKLIAISLKYNILCPYTAFVGIEKRLANDNSCIQLREVPIEIADNEDDNKQRDRTLKKRIAISHLGFLNGTFSASGHRGGSGDRGVRTLDKYRKQSCCTSAYNRPMINSPERDLQEEHYVINQFNNRNKVARSNNATSRIGFLNDTLSASGCGGGIGGLGVRTRDKEIQSLSPRLEDEEDDDTQEHTSFRKTRKRVETAQLYKQQRRLSRSHSRSRSRSRSPSHSRSRSRSRGAVQRKYSERKQNNDGYEENTVRRLIKMQQFDGTWNLNKEQLKEFLNVSDDQYQQITALEEDRVILSSIIIFVILKKLYQNDEQLWKPSVDKTHKYLLKHYG
ncbi:unnamed protein product, partial [Didymodactylos carnosus]